MDLERRKQAEAASYSRMGTAILHGNATNLTWLPDGSDDLGFTNGGKPIRVFVNWEHEMAKDLTDAEKMLLRMGVFAHELLHQCFTNFEYTEHVTKHMSRGEAAIFMKFANTLEDPAIEYFAPEVFGSNLLEALRFSISHIYRVSPGIENSKTPFSQLINALIHFGDMGVIKGRFTFPEAETAFRKIAGLYNEGITCPDSKKRLDIAMKCMELTRDLWEEDLKKQEEMEKLLQEMQEFLKKCGIHMMRKKEQQMQQGQQQSQAAQRRQKITEQIEQEAQSEEGEGEGSESEEQSEESSSSGKSGSKSGEEQNSDENQNESGKGQSSKSDEEKSEEEKEGTGEGEGDSESEDQTNGESDESEGSSGNGKNAEEEDQSNNGQKSDGSESGSLTTDEAEANEICEEEYQIDDSVAQNVLNSIQEEERKIEKAQKQEQSSEKGLSQSELPNFDISSKELKRVSCRNRVIQNRTCALAETYNMVVREQNVLIKQVKKTLDAIFKSDKEENHRSTSGSYNILRGTIGTTVRMFDKRKDPANLRDVAVFLAVDNSGSMSGQKIQEAKKAATVFAEALSELHIPYYIMGFEANGCSVEHHHFVGWNGNRRDRESIMAMAAGNCNMDGYTIRYATEMLKQKAVSNRILIVISDGTPTAYDSHEAGIADTINAIKDARRIATVFGIALGRNCQPEVIQKMYGKDFIFCQDPGMLKNTLCKKLEKCLMKKGAA